MENIKNNNGNLYACKCCGYKTLKRLDSYDICKVCGWEDVGDIEENKYSSPNRMTLKEAKINFNEKNRNNQIADELLIRYKK